MSLQPRVLIVDPSREARDILRVLLERGGTRTIEASNAQLAAELAHTEKPDAIVYDIDSDHSPEQQDTTILGETASRKAIPIVVLGTVRKRLSRFPTGELVSKPYQYGPLLRRIEELLGK